MCKWIDELQSQFKDYKEVEIRISLVQHVFISNLWHKDFKFSFYVIVKIFAHYFQ